MKVTKEPGFFIPNTKKPNYETAYEAMKSAIKYQMGWTVTNRRIATLTYVNNRHKITAKVGEVSKTDHQYEIVAILEATLYIIVTRAKNGQPGPTILVDTADVLEITDFKAKVEKPALQPSA